MRFFADKQIGDVRLKFDMLDELLEQLFCSSPDMFDVGANCGDTLFSIFEKNNDLYFYCFEADKEFFKYLKYNTKHN